MAITASPGDELMEALNSFSGFYVITTVNPDGSPNAAYFVYACIKNEDKYYVQLSLAENQTRQNLLANGKAVGVYAVTPSGEEGSELYAVSGARMELTLVTDEDLARRARSVRAPARRCTARSRPAVRLADLSHFSSDKHTSAVRPLGRRRLYDQSRSIHLHRASISGLKNVLFLPRIIKSVANLHF